MKKTFILLFTVLLSFTNLSSEEPKYRPMLIYPANLYESLVNDEADILSYNEERYLLKEMYPITKYGNVVFYSTDKDLGISTEEIARKYYENSFNIYSDGVIIVIDMYQRYIWILSYGDVYKVITDEYAQIVADSIYSLATDGDYYLCASEAFRLIAAKLNAESSKF